MNTESVRKKDIQALLDFIVRRQCDDSHISRCVCGSFLIREDDVLVYMSSALQKIIDKWSEK